MIKQPEVTRATKQAFIDAFCEICKAKPIKKVTIQELTGLAGYNRCTFYAYFNNVQELVKHIEDELISRVKDNVFNAIKNTYDAEQYISSLINILKGQEKYIEVLLLNSHNSNFAKRLKTVMIPAFMERYNIAKSDKKSKYALEYHLSGIIGLMTSWIINKRDLSMHQLGDVVRVVLSEGVLKVLKKPTNIKDA